jgi:hypothetical protein
VLEHLLAGQHRRARRPPCRVVRRLADAERLALLAGDLRDRPHERRRLALHAEVGGEHRRRRPVDDGLARADQAGAALACLGEHRPFDVTAREAFGHHLADLRPPELALAGLDGRASRRSARVRFASAAAMSFVTGALPNWAGSSWPPLRENPSPLSAATVRLSSIPRMAAVVSSIFDATSGGSVPEW